MTSNSENRKRKSVLSRFSLHLHYGCGFSSKIKVAAIVILGKLVSLRILPRIIEKILNRLSNYLCSGAIISVEGTKFKIPDSPSYVVCLPLFEDWMWHYLKPRENAVFLDVGAHIGKYALQIAKMVGEKGLVIAIEADPNNFRVLKENIELNKLQNVVALNIAAWSDNEKLHFFFGDSSALGSIKEDIGVGYVEVNARILDTVLEEIKGDKKVDWIKIDVEGAELETLKGLKGTLRESNPKLVVEVFAKNIANVTEYMSELGYKYEIVFESHDSDPPHVYMLFEREADK